MRLQFDKPGYSDIGGEKVYSHDLEVAVEIEPDESFACASWYVARCYIEGYVKNTSQWFKVEPNTPLFEEIKQWALDDYDHKLAELWETYLEDKPRRYRPTSDRDEHGTYRAGAL